MKLFLTTAAAVAIQLLVGWVAPPVLAQGPKIVGGKPALDGEFPAFAQPVFPGECRNYCGGTLIHPDIVMTAAHCRGSWLEAGQVAIGANTLCATDAEDTLDVVAEYNHPLFDEITGAVNDIALIKLNRASTVPPAKWNTNAAAPADNALVTACGLGDTTIGDGNTDVLLKVTIRSVNSDICVEQYENIEGAEVDPEVHLCAIALNKGVCFGDSGGPLFLFGTNIVAGITSYGIDCAVSDNAQVYTRVSTYDSWIQKTICQVSDVAPTAFSCDDFCGDGVCDSIGGFEDCVSCSEDCGVVCPVFGDGSCDVGESCKISPADCGRCSVVSASCPAGIDDTGLALTGIGVSITYNLDVPAGDSIVCTISGGTGDADLVITLDDYVCESDTDGNVDSCATPGAIEATKATIQVVAFEPFASVNLKCTCADFVPRCNDGFCTDGVETCETCPSDCGICPPPCKEGINETELRAVSEPLVFRITVSAGEGVACSTSGGSGDVVLDMFLGDFPVCSSDLDIDGSFTDEYCESGLAIDDGTVSVSVYPLAPFSGVGLVCTCTAAESTKPSASPTEQPSASPTEQPDGFPFNIPLVGPLLEFLFNIIFFWA